MDMQQPQAAEVQPTIESNRELTVTLSADRWNLVMFAMRRHPMPFEISTPVIMELQKQLSAQTLPRSEEHAAAEIREADFG